MARPKMFDREKAIEQLMFKFWQNGYVASSVKSLSEELGITRSSFYHAFTSREMLFKEVLNLYTHYTPLMILINLKEGEPVLPALTETFQKLCSMRAQDALHRGCLAMNSLAEITNSQEELACHMSEQLNLSNKRVELILTWAVQQKELSVNTDVKALALAVTALFVGVNIMSKGIHEEKRLWLSASTTLKALGVFRDSLSH